MKVFVIFFALCVVLCAARPQFDDFDDFHQDAMRRHREMEERFNEQTRRFQQGFGSQGFGDQGFGQRGFGDRRGGRNEFDSGENNHAERFPTSKSGRRQRPNTFDDEYDHDSSNRNNFRGGSNNYGNSDSVIQSHSESTSTKCVNGVCATTTCKNGRCSTSSGGNSGGFGSSGLWFQ